MHAVRPLRPFAEHPFGPGARRLRGGLRRTVRGRSAGPIAIPTGDRAGPCFRAGDSRPGACRVHPGTRAAGARAGGGGAHRRGTCHASRTQPCERAVPEHRRQGRRSAGCDPRASGRVAARRNGARPGHQRVRSDRFQRSAGARAGAARIARAARTSAGRRLVVRRGARLRARRVRAARARAH